MPQKRNQKGTEIIYAQHRIQAVQRLGPPDRAIPLTQERTGWKNETRESENPGDAKIQEQCEEESLCLAQVLRVRAKQEIDNCQ
jgi:hypothetical protein